ncbi:pum3 [Symbiodinium pilosum]|uniref:Pum3 protein n=1 Tax=Symbiodinium pilosum TaxID=2952 RepID=A0A812YCH8_SYMPI|nr:pum3 [Symbiodinium pilosum]
MAKKGGGPPRSGKKGKQGTARRGKTSKAKARAKAKPNKSAKLRSGAKKAAKGSGKGKAKASLDKKDAKAEGKGVKRKAREEPDQQEDKKGKKALTPKRKRKLEVTNLYSELINPGRTRKAEIIINDILEIIRKRSSNKLAQYCSTNVGARVIEACLKWGTRQQRRDLLTHFKETLPKMAQDRYGHQVVLKLLLYSSKTSTARKPTEEERKAQLKNLREILDQFSGKNLHATFYHRFGCKVINGIYFSKAVRPVDKRRILHAIAIPQAVALLRPELPSSKPLRQLLHAEDLTEQHKRDIAHHLEEAVEKAIEKELLGYDIVHLLFQAVCEVASDAQLTQLAEQCMDGAAYLLSSKPGAEALLRLLGVANAKQRKTFCRDVKGKFAALAMNSVDYVVMIRLATTVDDTVMLSKTMLAEWIKDMTDLCFDKYGHKVLAWILRPNDTHLFSPYECQCAALPSPTSHKAPETRRQELLRTLKPALGKALVRAPLKAAGDKHAKELLAAYLAADWDAQLVDALLASAEKEAAGKDLGLLNDGTVINTFLVLMKLDPDKGAKMAQPLWERCLKSHIAAAASSRCSFLLLAMLKSGDSLKESVLSAVRAQKKNIEKAVADAEASGLQVTGARKLLAEV